MDFVAARISEATALFDVQVLAYDSYGFRRNLEPELDRLGITIPLAEHPQGGKKRGSTGLWMPGSKKLLEDLILEGRIRIRRSPPVISAFMSATVEGDAFGNSWFSKRKATSRIDALIAAAMAVGAAAEHDSGGRSWWEDAA
jgi:phage terminase large subunit-like protein